MGAVRQVPEGLKPVIGPRVRELRDEVVKRGGFDLVNQATNSALGYVLAATDRDVDLAATAITMRPRPDWVKEFLGP